MVSEVKSGDVACFVDANDGMLYVDSLMHDLFSKQVFICMILVSAREHLKKPQLKQWQHAERWQDRSDPK